MSKEPVISNTSPLIGLWKLNLFSLYRELYTEVWIPREVEQEFLEKDETVHREGLNQAPWIKIVDLSDPESVSAYNRLDTGEAAVLALAKEHNARLVVIDEQKARKEAKNIGVPSIGVVGVLIEAKKNDLIGELKPLLIALRRNGVYLTESIINDALKDVGEK